MTGEEVRRRRARGEANRTRPSGGRSIGEILSGNVFTLFNAILAGAVVLLLAVGQVRDAFLTGSLVAFSVGVSSAQEVRAKLRLDRIALLARAPVRVVRDGEEQRVDQSELVRGDYLLLSRGESVVVDGVVGVANRLEVDESLLTGESEPVGKAAGDRLLSGSFCVAGSGGYVAEGVGEASYAQRLTSAARGYRPWRTPTQQLLDRVLWAVLWVVASVSLVQAVSFLLQGVSVVDAVRATAVMATLVPQGLLLMSTVAYSVGAVRLAQSGALVQQLGAVESLSHADTLCMDKTGTITRGGLRLRRVVPLGVGEEPARGLVGSFAASFPEPNATLQAIAGGVPAEPRPVASVVPFSSQRGWSALSFAGGGPAGSYVLGSPEALLGHAGGAQGVAERGERLAGEGERVLLFARAPKGISIGDGAPLLPDGLTPVALIGLEEEVRPDAAETLEALAAQGVSVKLISGDSPRTVLAIARRVGLPPTARAISGPELAGVGAEERPAVVGRTTVFGRVSPEGKVEIIRALQGEGHFVAMTGDGVNDVLALKQAQVGIAMRSGSAAARTVADVVLLEDSFAVFPRALEEGRRIVNSMMLLIKLFLVRDAATLGLILACGLVGAPFPLLPPHSAVIALLTVGIPSLFVVGWASSGTPGGESPRAMAGVVVLVGATSALAIMTVYVAMLWGLGVGVADARTGVVTAALASGLLALVVLWHPLDAPLPVLLSDRRVLLLAAGSLVLYLVALQSPVWQRYFELTPIPAAGLAGILAVVVAWFTGLRVAVRSGVVG